MKKVLLLICLLLATALFTNIWGQGTPPAVSDNVNLRDTNITMEARSMSVMREATLCANSKLEQSGNR